MVFKIVISKLAESEIEETVQFYEGRKKGWENSFWNISKDI
jgi:hypothetical protein